MSHVKDIMLLCRLCSVKDGVNVPIFGEDTNVLLKILACLPVKVSLEDNLPKRICDACFGKLESYYQFRNEAMDTEKQLLNLLTQAEELVIDSSFTTKQGQCNTIDIKQEQIDVSENVIQTGPKTQVSSVNHLEDNCVEDKTSEYTEDMKLNDVDEPLSKRRKISETLQTKVDKDVSKNKLNLPLTLDNTVDAKAEENCGFQAKEDCEIQDVSDQPQTPYLGSTNNKEIFQFETPKMDDALCTVIAQEDGKNKYNQIDSLNLPSNEKLKDCIVILGDLKNIDLKKYQFVNQTITELNSSISSCTLKCYYCGENFGSAVSSYINHIITDHSENEDDSVTNELTEGETTPVEKIISCKYCDYTFEDEASHQKHMVVVHPYLCGRCNRVFMNVHQSLLHTKMHFIMDKRKPEDKHTKSKIKNPSKNKERNEISRRKVKEEVKQTIEGMKQVKEEVRQVKEDVKRTKDGTKQTKEDGKQTETKEVLQELVKNYNCTECNSRFEDCYQLQRHCVSKHRKKPERRYECIKLYKCVLCAKHYPSQQMLEDHKATHLVDIRTAVEEVEPKMKEIQLPQLKQIRLLKPKETKSETPKSKEINLPKPEDINLCKPKEIHVSAARAMKIAKSPLTLKNEDVVEINANENKRPNLDESSDILDNVEIICNDIEFDNEDTTISNEVEQSQNQRHLSDPVEILPDTVKSHQTQLSTGMAGTLFQTNTVFPQINFIHPPPLVIPNLNQTVTRFLQVLPGNCSVITMPCATNSTTNSTISNFTKTQNLINNTKRCVQIDNTQACTSTPSNVVNKSPIVLNKYLKSNMEPVFKLKNNAKSVVKFRTIKPKLQVSNKTTTESASNKNEEELITVIIEPDGNTEKAENANKNIMQEVSIAPHSIEKSVETTNHNELLKSTNSEESNSKMTEVLGLKELNSKLMESKELGKANSCIKIDSSDSSESDNNKEKSDNSSSLVNQTKDVIEIDSSSDESKCEESAQKNSQFRALCAICNRRHFARHLTMKFHVYICTWCNYTVSVITKKVELFDKFKNPVTTGILTAMKSSEVLTFHVQCNVCKSIHAGTEYKTVLVVCNECRLKISSVTEILLDIKEKARYNNNKRTEQNKFCKVTCETCGIAVKVQTITYFNNKIVICDACRPKLFEIAAVSSGIHCKITDDFEEKAENVLLRIQCYICKDMKHISEISLLKDKSMCSGCKYNVSNFAIFLNILQKPRHCLNCKRLKEGLQLEELSTYCSKCLQRRPNICSECEKSGNLGQCVCKKLSEVKVKNTETEASEDEDKLIIDLESENKSKSRKRKGKKSKRRQSNSSSSSSIEIVEETATEENSVSQETGGDTPSTSSTSTVPKIFLKPMHSLLEPTAKIPIQKEINDQKSDTFACFYCSLVCNSKAAVTIHKDNVHLCRICKKYRENVSQHLKNIVKCQICQTIFCKKISLSDHYRQKHDSRWCTICDTVLRDDYEVLLHRKIVHNQS